MKQYLLLAALLLAGSAYADSPNPASDLVYAGIAADLGSRLQSGLGDLYGRFVETMPVLASGSSLEEQH